jgi:hypothetical protein
MTVSLVVFATVAVIAVIGFAIERGVSRLEP